MPYYSFHDREFRPMGMGSLEKKVINYFRSRFKSQYKTETRGEALLSAAGQFMAKEAIRPDQRALVIYFLKRHFKPLVSASDPTKPMVASKKPVGQTELTFESVLRDVLMEDADFIQLPKGGELYYTQDDACPFLFSKDGKSYAAIQQQAGNLESTHFDLMARAVEQWAGVEVDIDEAKITSANETDEFKAHLQDILASDDFERTYAELISGRIWLEGKAIGFWNSPEEVKKIFGTLLQLYPMIKPDWLLDFNHTDKGLQLTVGEYLKTVNFTGPKRSQEEREMMQRQHLETQFKKKLGAHPGSQTNSDAASVAGYNSSAKYNSQRTFGDSTIVDDIVKQLLIK